MPYKEEETETVLPFRGGFRRGSWNARKALELLSNGEVKSRGPRKFLIFGESGGQVPILLGPPKSFARMGKRKNDVALHFEFLEII